MTRVLACEADASCSQSLNGGSKSELQVERDLTGDRDLEWTYVAVRLARHINSGGRVLDFGCGIGTLAIAAVEAGARVLAIDLMPRVIPLNHPYLVFRQTDLMALDVADSAFDVIINCSSIEHVGLSGRYGATDSPDGDLVAMGRLRRLLRPGGTMLLTLPVGRDSVFRPLHRIYGLERLPRLLAGFDVIEAEFWRKQEGNAWHSCTREEALGEEGSERYYALGLLTLR